MEEKVLCPCKLEEIGESEVVRLVGIRKLVELLCSTDMGIGDLTSEDWLEMGVDSECSNVCVIVERVSVPEAVPNVPRARVLSDVSAGRGIWLPVVISTVDLEGVEGRLVFTIPAGFSAEFMD
jgi:hypothetical protein